MEYLQRHDTMILSKLFNTIFYIVFVLCDFYYSLTLSDSRVLFLQQRSVLKDDVRLQ